MFLVMKLLFGGLNGFGYGLGVWRVANIELSDFSSDGLAYVGYFTRWESFIP